MTLLDERRAGASSPPAFDFDGFVARHSDRLRKALERRTGDPHDAEEVLQEALLRAYQHRGAFDGDDGAAAWTTVVAQRLAVDRHRVARRSVSVAELPDSTRVGRDTADVVVASSEARVALDVLAELPRRQAAVLWAREVEGLSYAEIAARHALTEPTVRSVLARGRQALRREFVRRGHAVPAAGLVPFAPALLALRGGGELGRPVRRLLETKALAAAAVAVLAAGVVTAGGPWGAGAAPDRVVVPASATVLPPAAPAAPVLPSAQDPAPGPVGPAGPALPAAARLPAPPPGRTLPVIRLPEVCAGTAAVAGCVDDAPPAGGDRLVVDVALPDTPTGVSRPGIATDHVAACSELPSLPLTSCSSDPEPGDS